jgi:chlorite dismutase
MPDPRPPILGHFAFFRFTDRYWTLTSDDRAAFHKDWLTGLRAGANTKVYQVFPADTSADVLVWSSTEAGGNDDAAEFFKRFTTATTPYRSLAEATTILWGMTRPSQYSKARSKQEIDPMSDERRRYLIVYPFVKTTDWYLMGQESRQGMMNEHIRIGKEYTEITQLLLYSVGLQNQEFVVVYETDELALFSGLVNDLRATEGRRYTERDTPLHTVMYAPAEEVLALFR